MLSPATSSAAPVPHQTHLNAVKHGLRSAAVLLPGDDAARFHTLRVDLYHTYQPCTGEEARCVETIAGLHWRLERVLEWQARYDTHQRALHAGVPAGGRGNLSEPDPHRSLHRSMDCGLQENRYERLLTRARRELLQLQQLRRKNLIPDSVAVAPSYEHFLPEPLQEAAPRTTQPTDAKEAEAAPETAAQPPTTSLASASVHKQIRKNDERTRRSRHAARQPHGIRGGKGARPRLIRATVVG